MSKYRELKSNPPIIDLKKLKDKQDVIFTVISCMCDNKAYFRLKKNENGEFRLNTYNDHCGLSYSNFQTGHPQHKIEWAADANKWADVVNMINSGTSVISEFISR